MPAAEAMETTAVGILSNRGDPRIALRDGKGLFADRFIRPWGVR